MRLKSTMFIYDDVPRPIISDYFSDNNIFIIRRKYKRYLLRVFIEI